MFCYFFQHLCIYYSALACFSPKKTLWLHLSVNQVALMWAWFSELTVWYGSVNLGLIPRGSQHFTAIYSTSWLGSWLMTFWPLIQRYCQTQLQSSLLLTSPTPQHRARCPSPLLLCTQSRTETHPALGFVCASCPCWPKVCVLLRPSPLKGWSWSFLHGRRPPADGQWVSPSTCRTVE